MSEERKARIAVLEAEAQRLKSDEAAERRAMLKARVDALFEGLHLDDVPVVQALVVDAAHRIWVLEGDDDE